MESLLIIFAIVFIFYWLKTGRKGQKLYNKIEEELTTKYGWSSNDAFYIWKIYNKEIVNMQLNGLSAEEIATKINSEYKDKTYYS